MDKNSGFVGFGAGKVILLGEHSVVYGYPALAGPLSRGVTARGEASNKCQLVIPDALMPEQRKVLKAAFGRAMAVCDEPGVKVTFNTDLPLSMGLGSSGALSVACARVLLQAAGRKGSPAEVASVAWEMEQEFHGTPSGVDHTTSTMEQLILYRRKPGAETGRAKVVESPKPVRLVVVMAGARSPTKTTVGALRERQKRWSDRYQRVFREIGLLASEGAEAVEEGDLEGLGDVMNVNHGLLAALGLSSPGLDDMVHRLRGMGALGAKLTGAGGDGGAVIGLFPETEPVVHELTRQGYRCFDSQLAGPRSEGARGAA
ncbi:mevalonate kinase [Archangium primigenium]|uniref:mevalonate kinase n=1 Tax=Melittangium TaxID=44 RepID=UPI00195D993F|nr:mevalonate kinase [Archangium primigenium]MBM7117801.1 mevalonate kinase [Archangium primigenium]